MALYNDDPAGSCPLAAHGRANSGQMDRHHREEELAIDQGHNELASCFLELNCWRSRHLKSSEE